MSTWTLFLDDERHPVRNDVVVCRTSLEAIEEIRKRGCPVEMMLDHDLGPGDDASKIFYAGFENLVLDGLVSIPEGFRFSVHSQNPVGGNNLAGKIDSLLREMERRARETRTCL
ncbi:hypothetical protein E4L95_00925 [Paracoccus liaowanqingii]|uniref:Cyclic-phosphate processing Receiver domain-containing protein n=1 Tax=Paracoccus liaowanqingii TaxID=2560053 RepID=A0A4Z1CSU0_9RHOB|nr:cyclic-phosphate processing receiver domain-containing protein [Paracoccus liaowanqingii]TGN68548.1 hypothetical protein E4L95_00925 [Paracoccus liaowanqingii]